jgi:outer membrane protein assembly factor BamB/ubiquinone/menaquinone biosynthesis C-methylase UbiE
MTKEFEMKPTLSMLSLTVLLLAATPLLSECAPDPLLRWVFDSAHIQGKILKADKGPLDATLTGPLKVQEWGAFSALLLNKENNLVELPSQRALAILPRQEITAEAWLAIDQTTEWGGAIGLIQEEKGFLLGDRQSSFSFGVSGKDTPGFTHLRSPHSLEWGQWHHLVGTYDGHQIVLYVNGEKIASSTAQRGEIEYPEAGPFTIGSFEKFFGGQYMHEVALYDRALTAEEISEKFLAKKDSLPKVERVAVGPWLVRVARDTLTLSWETLEATPSRVLFGKTLPLEKEYGDDTPTTSHSVTIEGIEHQEMYYYRIVSDTGTTRLFEFDASLDQMPTRAAVAEDPFPQDEWSSAYTELAERVVSAVPGRKGYCVILGCGQGRLAYEIAKRSRMQIACFDENEENISATRRNMDLAGLYGIQVTAHRTQLENLPVGDYLANVIVSDNLMTTGEVPSKPDEVFRICRPFGGKAILGSPVNISSPSPGETAKNLRKWLEQALDAADMSVTENENGAWIEYERGPLVGSGTWTHQYADAGNSSCSQDPYAQGDMKVLWFGKPGPRPMVDRGTRSSAPLSIGGHLFVQGDRRLFGIDAYNGTLRWILEIPNLRRANLPRDCGNMTADSEALYAAIQNQCWKLDPITGERIALFEVHPEGDPTEYDWGYLARDGDNLFGSGVRRGATFIGADGEWYDDPNEESHKVLSDFLFAASPHTGERVWTYREGAIINSTIAIGDGSVYFIETRSPQVLNSPWRRCGKEALKDQFLVSLDATTGEKRWERPMEIEGADWVYYLLYASDTLVALGTTHQYHIHTFSATSSEPLWNTTYELRRDHHGGAMQHPAIIGDTLYTDSRAFGLRSGEVLLENDEVPPRRGCGTIAGAARSVFYRHYYHTVWDLDTGEFKEYEGLRTGCWLGIIPAGGVVLAPESSAGCHCTEPIQTSIAFMPVP